MFAKPTSIFSRRAALVRGAFAVLLAPFLPRSSVAAVSERALTPEQFGAKGDAVSNDTAALARLAAAVNAAGGGLVSFAAGKTYVVGGQTLSDKPKSRYLFEPLDVLVFTGCTRPLTIRGNGARLKCAPGLRFGTFDRSGNPTQNPMPFTGRGQGASPYRYMIQVEACSGPIEISDLELDGNLGALVIGGKFGDQGWQLAGSGLGLFGNSASETVRNIHTHHHPKDGLYVHGLAEAVPGTERRLSGIRAEYNGRQACSITSGNGYVFRDCRFNHTGRGGLSSAPGAGVDIEANRNTTNRNLRFVGCEFVNNRGVGMVADSGNSEGALFERCKFVGATSWAVWPKKPRFRFNDCTFVGPIVHAWGDEDPQRASQFHDCRFLDNPALSPTGEVKGRGGASPIANLRAGGLNVLFSNCEFLLTHDAVLPWTKQAIYSNCRMRQASPKRAYPRGTYLGTSSIVGNVQLTGSRILGTLTVNGTRYTG